MEKKEEEEDNTMSQNYLPKFVILVPGSVWVASKQIHKFAQTQNGFFLICIKVPLSGLIPCVLEVIQRPGTFRPVTLTTS